MGWSIGYDSNWKRDIGYGVPAQCDHPACTAEIDRGLSYVCGGEPYGGEHGCGLYFCQEHLKTGPAEGHGYVPVCSRCKRKKEPFDPKPDVLSWISHKLIDESWSKWRDENPAEVAEMAKRLDEQTSSLLSPSGENT